MSVQYIIPLSNQHVHRQNAFMLTSFVHFFSNPIIKIIENNIFESFEFFI